MPLTDEEKIQIAADNGIQQAGLVFEIAAEEGVPFYIACAFLEQATGGGWNVFGSDPTGFRGVDMLRELGDRNVTKERYLLYRMNRAKTGPQGIGPMQITFPATQDEVDAMGGCWKFEPNTRRGLQLVAEFKESEGDWDGAAGRYNGSGRDGAYAAHNRELRHLWRDRLDGRP